MDQNQNSSLFSLNIDNISKGHLLEAARWGKFLAVVGFVVCVLIILAGIFMGSIMGTLMNRSGGGMYDDMNTTGLGAMMAVVYVVIALVYFFPCLFLYRFATKMKAAIATNDQNTLNGSFQNLKAMFRYVGIITLILLIIYGLSLIVVLVSAA